MICKSSRMRNHNGGKSEKDNGAGVLKLGLEI